MRSMPSDVAEARQDWTNRRLGHASQVLINVDDPPQQGAKSEERESGRKGRVWLFKRVADTAGAVAFSRSWHEIGNATYAEAMARTRYRLAGVVLRRDDGLPNRPVLRSPWLQNRSSTPAGRCGEMSMQRA